MFSVVPFFIAGLFFPFWPWGLLAAVVWMPLMMLLSIEQFVSHWRRDRLMLIQTMIHAVIGSILMNGGTMLLANGIRWLIGAW